MCVLSHLLLPLALWPSRPAAALANTSAASTTRKGRNLELIELPAPPHGGTRPWSYTTFLPINGGLLVPSFDAATDLRAADILAGVFPGRVVVRVPAAALAEMGVSLTSLALPHPARLLERDRATVLPRSAWSQPEPDAEAVLQKYIDMANADR